MRLVSRPVVSRSNSGSQWRPHRTLITFQPAPLNTPSSSCTILPLPRTGPSRRCRLQLITNTRFSSCSRPASEIAPRVSGSSHSPSPRNAHTLRLPRLTRSRGQVTHHMRLVDRLNRAQTHGYGRELPEVRHQPGMRVGGQTVAIHFTAEVVQLLFGQAAFKVGSRIDTR